MAFAQNLRALRKSRHVTQNQLAEYLGYKSFTTIQKWEDGTATPNFDTLMHIADYFDIDINTLMEDEKYHDNSDIPVLGVVRGGLPIDANQDYLGFEHVYPDDARHPNCFYLEVTGDSMREDRILPGDLVYVQKQDYLNNGDIGVVLLDGYQATVKRVYYKGENMILQPSNPNYAPLVLTKEDQITRQVKIIGKVLHNRIKF